MIELLAIIPIVSVVLLVILSEVLRRRPVKVKCLHEWSDAGKVGYDGTRALYCPICDKSTQVGEVAAKIMLNEVMIRKLHDGSRRMTPCRIVLGGKNEPNCTYPIVWKAADNERMRRIVQQEVRAELNRRYLSVDKVPTNVR